MTIVMSGSPGSGSNSLKSNFEHILNCKSKTLKSGNNLGHAILTVPTIHKIFYKIFKNKYFYNTKLIYGHIFPTKYNLNLLNNYFDIDHIVITYRNIYEQLNNFYKWQKYYFKTPLSFSEDVNFRDKNEFDSNNFNIDLTLLLVLNFYKHWFYLIQNNKIKNFTLFDFKEIKFQNEEYKKKIKNIFKNEARIDQINIDVNIKDNLFKKEKFELNIRHKNLIKDFISFHKNIDFSLII